MGAKLIDISLFDDNIKALLETSTKIFPIPYSEITGNVNSGGYEYTRPSDDDTHKNEIYRWNTNVWTLIGADDTNITWTDIKSKPLTFAPSTHQHVSQDITDLPTVPTSLSQLSGDSTHRIVTDAEKATWDTVTSKSDSTHNHDGRYYTQSQVDTSLTGKQATLVSGTNIKTVNSTSLVGSGNVAVQPTLVSGINIKTVNSTSLLGSGDVQVQPTLVSGTSIKTINGTSLLGSGDIVLSGSNTFTSTATDIKMNGVQSVGVLGTYPRADHVHPSDTSKQDALGYTPVNTTDSRLSDSRKCNNTFDDASTARTNLGLDSIYYTESEINTMLANKADTSTVTGHTGNSTVHVLQTDKDAWNAKQAALVSGTSIKTVNSTSLLGSGDVAVQPTLVSGTNIKTVNSTSLLGSGNVAVQATLVSGTNIKTVNSTSLLGSGDVAVQPTLVSGTNIKTVNGSSILGSGDLVISVGGAGVVTGATQPDDEFWMQEVSSSSLSLGGLIASSDDVPQGSTNLYTTTAEKTAWNAKQATITSYNSKLAADVALTTTGTWYDGPSISLPAGTYLVSATITAGRTSTGATTYYSRISDGTNHYASVSNYMASVANSFVSAGMSTIITLASTTTIKIQTTTNSGASTAFMKAALATYGSGNNATQISAIKIA